MATLIRGNQKIQVADKRVERFVKRGWHFEQPKPNSQTKKPPKMRRSKTVEAVVDVKPTVIHEDDLHDFEQQNQGFVDDNFNQEGEN